MKTLEELGVPIRCDIARRLYDRIARLDAIDAHEHLFAERFRVSQPVDAVAMFQQQYPALGLLASGMPASELDSLADFDRPLDERWATLKPRLDDIRGLALPRALMLGIHELYGFDRIDDGSYVALTEAMQAFNRPGIYGEIFRDRCRVKAAFVQQYNSVDPPWEMPPSGSFRIAQMFENLFNVAWRSDALPRVERCVGRSLETLDDFLDAVEPAMAHYQREGVIGIKLMKQAIGEEPARQDVAPLFSRLVAEGEGKTRSPELVDGERAALRDSIGHAMLRAADSLGLRVMFHSGMRPAIDFRSTDQNLHVPLFVKYPRICFEVFHCGMPWVRDAGMIAMSFPNVWLNMCWTQSLSPRMARSALSEWLEHVPHNKIIAFGGDSAFWIEHTVGDLIHTRVNLAKVLAERVSEGESTEDEAVHLAERMLFDNAAALYGLTRHGLERREYN